jgi:hypothetical protein
MTSVSKPDAAGPTSPGAARRGDTTERAPKPGDFEAVLKDKGRAGRAAEPEAARAAEAGLGGAAPRGQHGRGSGLGEQEPATERRSGEGGEWRALPGDVAVPAGLRFEPAAGAVESATTAEAVARIERIAEQIVRAAELRLGPGGTAEAHLELDLGALGPLRVNLGRDAEGTIGVRFEGAGAEAARLLAERGSELVARLEARGLVLSEVTLRAADGSALSLTPPASSQTPEADAGLRPGARPAAPEGGDEASRQRFEDERRRRPPEAPVIEDEE